MELKIDSVPCFTEVSTISYNIYAHNLFNLVCVGEIEKKIRLNNPIEQKYSKHS